MANPAAADASVAANLAHADKAEGVPHVGTAAQPEHHADPSLLGLDATVWVSVAMLAFIALVVWKGGVKAITAGLDRQIADIKAQLDAAKTLRAEAEALRDEYAKKNAEAEKSAADMLSHAEDEAKGLIAKARADANDLVARRAKMAEDKIAAAERAAIAEVRAKTADAATKAAGALIADKLGAAGDKALVDRTIAGLGRPN